MQFIFYLFTFVDVTDFLEHQMHISLYLGIMMYQPPFGKT